MKAGGRGKNKENVKTMVPITNDDKTQYHTGVLKTRAGKKASDISLDDRLKALSVDEDNEAQGQSLVKLLVQVLHSNDDRYGQCLLWWIWAGHQLVWFDFLFF